MTRRDIAAAMALIDTVDLSHVTRKVMQEEGWDAATAAKAVGHYRRFLCMRDIEPTLDLVPTDDIDKVWHQHILFTRAYADDCQRLFGRYIHHEPATGAAEEKPLVQDGLERTQALYFELFGEEYVEGTWLSHFLA